MIAKQLAWLQQILEITIRCYCTQTHTRDWRQTDDDCDCLRGADSTWVQFLQLIYENWEKIQILRGAPWGRP